MSVPSVYSTFVQSADDMVYYNMACLHILHLLLLLLPQLLIETLCDIGVQLFVLTQWNSNALNQHIYQSFPPSTFGNHRQRGFVDVLTANQTPRSSSW